MAQRHAPDAAQVERLFNRVVTRRDGGDPLDRYVYLEDREALLYALLDRVRRDKHAMIAEAVAGGMSYRQISARVGVNTSRVMQLLRKAQRAAGEVSTDA